MSYKLSILIPTIPGRLKLLKMLVKHLNDQIEFYQPYTVEVVINYSTVGSIGTKRNELLLVAQGEYTAFIDDDDRVSDDYINKLLWGIRLGVDCCSLKGIYTIDGKNPETFEHSIKYNEWRTNGNFAIDMGVRSVKYERYPNHLNCIRADIAKQFKFPEINHGEDHNWAKQIHESGLLKTEHYIDEIIYYYDKRTNHV